MLTLVTVLVSFVDLGKLNFFVAALVAICKATIVLYFFMNLRHDSRDNAVIFLTSLVFLTIFFVLTSVDVFFRGDVKVKGAFFQAVASVTKKPWIKTPELVAHGKEQYAIQCAMCHGAVGAGNGPAAAALVPPPRDFTKPDGWKNGRKATMVFKTLKDGLAGSAMASYATLPEDDRWALAHYIISLGSEPPADTAEDFAVIGIDPNKEGSTVIKEPKITIRQAMALLQTSSSGGRLYTGSAEGQYGQLCASCHGDKGQGGIKVGQYGLYAVTKPFDRAMTEDAIIASIRGTAHRVTTLSQEELTALARFVQNAAKR